ncbi:hypothetical protein AAVH_27888 [Aphelenchoides avenae]|nr:hypothetical protein AAVH_27888 [Aphelenchus avenae]
MHAGDPSESNSTRKPFQMHYPSAIMCPMCKGDGCRLVDEGTQDYVTCSNCNGSGEQPAPYNEGQPFRVKPRNAP